MGALLSGDERVSHGDSLAKYAAVGSSGACNSCLQYSRRRLKLACMLWGTPNVTAPTQEPPLLVALNIEAHRVPSETVVVSPYAITTPTDEVLH